MNNSNMSSTSKSIAVLELHVLYGSTKAVNNPV